MILIDEEAESTLAAFLEAFKLAPDHSMRCLHFHARRTAGKAGLKEVLIASAQRNLVASNPRIFFCEAGDIIVIADPIPSRDGNRVILDVVDYLNIAADQHWVVFDELSRQSSALLACIEPALEKRRIAEEEARRLEAQQMQARKRQAILSGAVFNPSIDIQQRRAQRNNVELMMIEDDAFSRRLVENVLQKKYALTSLGDATHAIDTYARTAPDILFLDINLPDVTGHELLERLLTIDPHAHVIMLSGNADQANIVVAIGKGAKGFIAKPFTKEKLFQYIDRCPGISKKQSSVPVT